MYGVLRLKVSSLRGSLQTASPKPQSKNPELWEHWISQAPFEPDFEKICSDWEKGVKDID